MLPHQERVVQEKNELKEKVDNLGAFILDNPIYNSLEGEEQSRLNEQHYHMCFYLDILNERIKNFK
jgi:hypothetical protein